MYLGEILKKIDFPKGVLNFVAGDAKEIGKPLCESPIPAMLTMIGSTKGGLDMIRDSSTSVKRFSMELGGNAPVIVTPSADLKAAAAHSMGNKMRCAGQTCVSPQRAFVHASVYDEFLRLCVEQGKTAKCGTLDEDANTGPMISRERPDDKKDGYYFLPTVLTHVTRDMKVFHEEVFGPILAVMPYENLDDAIEMANDTEYGLSSYIWSSELKEINKIARGIKYGIVNVNGPGTGPSVPHGGCKNSGIGKDGSRYSLEEYTYIKGMRISLA